MDFSSVYSFFLLKIFYSYAVLFSLPEEHQPAPLRLDFEKQMHVKSTSFSENFFRKNFLSRPGSKK
jgi:hypothetical protein